MGGEKIYIDPVVEPRKTLADNAKVKQYLNWKPTTKIEDWVIKYKETLGL